VVWVAVFQRNILFASSGSTLKMKIVCFFRTISISSYFVSVSKEAISVPFEFLNEVIKLKGDRVCFK